MPKPKGGRGMEPNKNRRIHLSEKMLTRQGQGRLSPNEEEEMAMNKTLADAGVLDDNMSFEEKRSLIKVLQESRVNVEEEKTQKFASDSHSSPPSASPVRSDSQHQQHTSACHDDQVICLSQSSSGDSSDHSPINSQSASTAKDLHVDSNRTHCNSSNLKEDKPACSSLKENTSRLLTGVTIQERGRGRGRATPTKYTTLAITTTPARSPYFQPSNNSTKLLKSPLSQPSTSKSLSSLQDRPSSPQQYQEISSKPQNSAQIQVRVESPEVPDSTSSPNDDRFEDASERAKDEGDDNTEMLSIDIKEPSQSLNSPLNENQQNSPASVEDAEDVEIDDDRSCKSKILIGKYYSHVSPLENQVKKITAESRLPFIEELKQFKGNKCEWLTQAYKIVSIHRNVYWDRLATEKCEWGPPIPDGGYNKETLFKQTAPKYSKLFATPKDKQAWTSGRSERSAKTQAMTKIQEAIQDDWLDETFRAIRKSAQVKQESKSPDLSYSKQVGQNNAWRLKKKPNSTENEDGGEDFTPENDEWATERMEQKNKFADSDSEVNPESPSGDVYEFEQGSEDFTEIWSTAAPKTRKNHRRNGKTNSDDIEVDAKPNQRNRVPNTCHSNLGSRQTKLRLKKGNISRPSEHGQSSGIKELRHSSEQFEGDAGNTAKQNNVNNENRAAGWLNTEQMKSDSMEIAPKKFFPNTPSPRVPNTPSQRVQPVFPRNLQSGQTRKPVRENRRPSDFVPSPGTSGNLSGRHEGNESSAAPVEVACPICGRGFLKEEIETHASGCQEYSSSAVGEESNEIQDSEESDKTVIGLFDKAELPSHGGSEVTEIKTCDQCKEQFAPNELVLHIKECIKVVSPPSAGQKRASSLDKDDGPAKRTRIVE